MTKRNLTWALTGSGLAGLAILLSIPSGNAQQPPAGKTPATVTVEQGTFAIKLDLNGAFESTKATPVTINLEASGPRNGGGPLIVESAIDHGTRVKEGDVLVKLDTEAIGRQIQDLKTQVQLDELDLQVAEKELALLNDSVPLDLAQAERTLRIAQQDLQKYLDKDREFAVRNAEESLKSAKSYLENAQEELTQLQKMYEADDLTEETEEIVLKRQKRSVESAMFRLESVEQSYKDTVEIDLPRRDESMKDTMKEAAIALEKARVTLPTSIEQKDLAVRKAKVSLERSRDKLAGLEKDMAAMSVKAPASGIVYHGRWVNGEWTAADSSGAKLVPGGNLLPNEVFMTVVDPAAMTVRVTVEEKDLYEVAKGMAVKVVPKGLPGNTLAGKVETISLVPASPGKFDATVAVELPQGSPLVPGMAATVKATPYAKRDALTLPASAVFSDELDDANRYVYILNGDDPERIDVTVGRETEDRVEILSGLKKGDEVLKEKP